jgi:MFS family permease
VAIDRFGVRALLATGSLMLAGGYLAYAHVSTLEHVYLIHLVFAAALVASGVNVSVIMVSAWFVRHRGTAIGLVLIGTSVGGVLFPPLITALIAQFGWRAAFQLMALAPMQPFWKMVSIWNSAWGRHWNFPCLMTKNGTNSRLPCALQIRCSKRQKLYWHCS